MLEEDTPVNSKFLKVFTSNELNDIIGDATVVTDNCIIISTEDNFFELSSSSGNELDIYSNDNNGNEKQLTKDEFMKLYRNSPTVEIPFIIIDE